MGFLTNPFKKKKIVKGSVPFNKGSMTTHLSILH